MMSRATRYFSIALCLALSASTVGAQKGKEPNKEEGRLAECATVMTEILNVPDDVPQEVLDKAECVIVIPSMTKVAIGVLGGS
jgi:lipid-binding SYLF domain-containing protein